MSSSLDHANRIVDLETSRIEHNNTHFTLDDKIAALERTTTTHGLNIADLEQATTTNTTDHASFASAIQTLDGTATFHGLRLNDVELKANTLELALPGKLDEIESASGVLSVTVDTDRPDKRKIARVELDTTSLLATTQTSIAALETAKVDHSSRLVALETSNIVQNSRLTSLDTVVATKIDTLSTDTTLVTTVTTNPATQEKAVAVRVNTTQVALKSDIPFPLSDATYNFPGRTYGLYCCVNVNGKDFQVPNFGVMLCHLTNDLCHVMMSGNFTLSDPAVNANSNVRIYLPFEIVSTTQVNYRGPTVAQRSTGKVHGSVQGGPVIDCATISSYSNQRFMRLYLEHSPVNGQQFLLGTHIFNKMVIIQELSIWFKPRYPPIPIPQCHTAI